MDTQVLRKITALPSGRTAGGVAVLVFLLYLALAARVSGWYAGQVLEERRAEVELDASVRANAISSGVSRRLLLLEGFSAFMEVMAAGQASESQMQFYIQTVYPTVEGIYGLGVAPAGRVNFVFPQQVNVHLADFSFYASGDPTVARAAGRAAESGNLFLVGPVELGYPEPVLLALNAIYNEGELWGFVFLLADIDPLLNLVGETSTLAVALRSGNGLLLYGDSNVLMQEPVLRRVEFPDGAWQLAAIPLGGWEAAIAADLRGFQLALLFVGALLAGLVFLALRRQFELSQAVEVKTAEAESAGEKERSRLARELHDSVSQALYGIALGARTLRKRAENHPAGPDLLEPADYILNLAEGGLAEMRALLMGLRPEELEEQGLSVALARLGDGLAARHQIQVQMLIGREPALTLDEKVALYRIAQEATHNSMKHAQASRIELRLSTQDGVTQMMIADDGLGFDPHGDFPGHLGLKTMRERAELLGGTCEIYSLPGTGTRVQVTLDPRRGREVPAG